MYTALVTLFLTACGRGDIDDDGFKASEDCDDNNAEVNPGAEEICDDGVDNDCDGEASPECRDEGVYDAVEDASSTSEGEVADGRYGFSVDVTGTGNIVVGAPGSNEASVIDANGTGTQLSGDESEDAAAGWSVSSYGNGSDGYVLVGDPNTGGDYAGSVYIVPEARVLGNGSLSNIAEFTFVGNDGDNVGTAVSSVGDQNGDGVDDVVVGAAGRNKFYLLRSSFNQGMRTNSSNVSEITLSGEAEEHGVSATGGCDVNGDGRSDFAVAVAGSYAGRTLSDACKVHPLYPPNSGVLICRGEAGIFLGPVAGDRTIENADVRIEGDQYEQLSLVKMGGDFNGDGIADIIVAAPCYGFSGSSQGYTECDGAVYVFYGRENWPAVLSTQDADFMVTGARHSIGLTGSAADFVDFDGDGIDDLVVGSPLASDENNNETGMVSVFYGGRSRQGRVTTEEANITIHGEQAGSLFGQTLAIGDTDEDGLDDIVVGAPDANSGEGKIYQYNGHSGL